MELKSSHRKNRAIGLYSVLTALMLLLSPLQSHAQVQCRELFYGKVKKDFVHDPTYKVLIPDQSEIKNQCALSTCHLYSWASMLEHKYKEKYHEDIKISTHYLSVSHWVRRSLEALKEGPEDQVSMGLEANVFASRWAILTYGIIPDEAWTASRDFQVAPLSKRISEYLKNIVARAKWDMSSQVDEAKIRQIRVQGENKILDVFKNLVGEMPSQFQ
jgi:hypothetical protein